MHRLTNEELDKLPLSQFEGQIDVIDNAESLAKAVEEISQETRLGFDTETRPSFRRGMSYGVSLLQLSTATHAWLIRVNKVEISDELAALLENENITKTGVAIRDDIKALQKRRKFQPRGFVELQTIANQLHFEDFSLKKLAAHVLGIRISKRQRLSNWEADELALAQQHYAATDAWVSLLIYEGFEKGVTEHERVIQAIAEAKAEQES
ncbi:MAG: 3'-5' exonuclease domain-containing protein 2 [Marinilabiliaceae bacterium]|nr:3'-5' exonuclease domain-containing protein 2 [Marinilabiliaceae bacterium]